MQKVEHDLLTGKFTDVWHEEHFQYNAPHHFKVTKAGVRPNEEPALAIVDFQEGPIKEVGVNGVNNEDLIAMVICRLEHFQQTDFSCRENAICITKLEEALLWLRKRTMARDKRGVKGTSVI